jgi:hypothetical protein
MALQKHMQDETEAKIEVVKKDFRASCKNY